MPILARHAVSLSVAFVLGLVLSYFVGQAIYQRAQLNKLSSPDQATFERGVGHVVTNAGGSEAVTDRALEAVRTIDPQRAADVLLAIVQSHANREVGEGPSIPDRVIAEIPTLMQRLKPVQAVGLYDGLIQIKGINPVTTAESLLDSIKPGDDAELLLVVELLDTRLLWSKQWAPLDLWVRWLSVLAESGSELTQFNTAKRLGDLPGEADDPRIIRALSTLSASTYDTVRNRVLYEVAGYAAIAEDPTGYEQIIFALGGDANKHIARRAWMTVGHLNPFSGFAVNWKNADPFVAEAMLWAAVKTNPENPKPALQAINSAPNAPGALLALSQSTRYTFSDLATMEGVELPYRTSMETDLHAIAVWRRLLALNPHTPDPEHWYIETTSFANSLHDFHEKYGSPTSLEIDARYRVPFYLAASYRLNADYGPTGFQLSESESTAASLAAVEGRLLRPFGQETATDTGQPMISKLVNASYGKGSDDLLELVGQLPLNESTLLDLFTLALSHADQEVVDRFIRSSHPQMLTMAAIASAMKGYKPRLIHGINADFIRKHPELGIDQIRGMTDPELSELGLSRVDALPALLEAARLAPPTANRSAEAKMLRLALWLRGDLAEGFTPTAEAMLYDKDLPTSTVLMCLLYMKRPVALDYLFADLVTPRPDPQKLLIQERYWHVFRRFVDTSGLTLWLWGDPGAQAFQLEAMRQWYAVNRWKIKRGDWPTPDTTPGR